PCATSAQLSPKVSRSLLYALLLNVPAECHTYVLFIKTMQMQARIVARSLLLTTRANFSNELIGGQVRQILKEAVSGLAGMTIARASGGYGRGRSKLIWWIKNFERLAVRWGDMAMAKKSTKRSKATKRQSLWFAIAGAVVLV